MLNVTQAFLDSFNAPVRTVEFSVGLIERSNYNTPENITITVNTSGYKSMWTKPNNVIDGQPLEPHKYWVAHAPGDNIPESAKFKLQEGYLRRLWGAAVEQPYNHGWWSNTKSDGQGNFSTYPWVEIIYSAALPANFVRVCTTQVFSGIKIFRLSLWCSGASQYTIIGTYTIPENQNQYTVALGEVKQILKIKVEVLSTYWPNDYARITEIAPVLEWSPSSTAVTPYVTDLRVEKSSGNATLGKPHAPGIGSNRVSLTFSREALNICRPAENQQLTAYMKFSEAPDILPLGQFVILGEVEEDKVNLSCEGYSSLQLAKYYDLPDYIFRNETTKSIVRKILEDLGFSANKMDFALENNPTWAWYAIEGKRGDRLLADICDHFGIAIYQDETGKIVIRSSYGNPVITLNDDLITDLRITRAATINAVTVHYSTLHMEAEDKVWENDELELPGSSTTTFVFPLSKRPAVNLRPLVGITPPINGVFLNVWQCNGFFVNVVLVNTNTSPVTVPRGSMYIVGNPVSMSPEKVAQAKNSASIARLGYREYALNLYCGKDSEAQAVADRLLNHLSKADLYNLEMGGRPAPHLQLRDVVTVNSQHFGVNKEMVITSISLDKNGTSLELIPKEALT